MNLHLAAFTKCEAETSKEQADLERRILLLDGHLSFSGDVTPLMIDKNTGKAIPKFLARWHNGKVEIKPIRGELPEYYLNSIGSDGVTRMLNVYEQSTYSVEISLRTSLQEEYTHYRLFRNPEYEVRDCDLF